MELSVIQQGLPIMDQFGRRARKNKEGVILTSPLSIMVPIIKIVGDFCNLRCQYCFYNVRDQSTPHVMSDKMLEKFISEYMNLFNSYLFFIWHGGEPLLAGREFFERAVAFQEENARDDHEIRKSRMGRSVAELG